MNVLGDSFGADIVAHLSKKELEEMDWEGDIHKYLMEERNGVSNTAYDETETDVDTKMWIVFE